MIKALAFPEKKHVSLSRVKSEIKTQSPTYTLFFRLTKGQVSAGTYRITSNTKMLLIEYSVRLPG